MPVSSPKQLRVGGVWLNSVAPWGELAWKTQWPGGMYEITWTMTLPDGFHHPALTDDSLVELFDGPLRIGQGVLQELDFTQGTFNAYGLFRLADDGLALDASLAPTSVPDTAIDQGIARGILQGWTRAQSLSAVAFTTSGSSGTSGTNTIGTLLSGYTDQAGTRLYVDADGFVSSAADPTTPTWFLAPGTADLGRADGDYASDLFGTYLTTSGTYGQVSASDAVARSAFGRDEYPVDLTSFGPMSAAKAQSILQGILTKGGGRPAFTQSVTVSSQQLTTAGGVAADPSMVAAGQMVRSFGLYDDIATLNGQTYLDWVIGETDYADGDDTIGLTPLNVNPNDLASVIAALAPTTNYAA